MRVTTKFLVLSSFLLPASLFADVGEQIDTGGGQLSGILDQFNGWQLGYSWTATEQVGNTYSIDVSWSENDLKGGGCVNWEVFVKRTVGGQPISQTTLCSNTQNLGITGVPLGESVLFGLYNPYAEGDFAVEIFPGSNSCQDIDISTSINNTSDAPRVYYWEMNEGSGWIPAETPTYGLWSDIVLGAGESMTVTMTLTAEENPNCAEFVLRSCAAFNSSDSPDQSCGQVELTADPNGDDYTQPTSDGPHSYGPGEFDNDGSTAAFDSPDINPDPADLATTRGQEDQITAAQQLARWQAIQNYNNTQNIVSSMQNIDIDGATLDVDMAGVETRLDEVNLELDVISGTLLDDSFEAPGEAPTDQTEANLIKADIQTTLDNASTAVSNAVAAIPPAPILPNSLGSKSFIEIDFAWKDIPPFTIDFTSYSTQINWFREVLKWLIYLITWFTAVKIIRGAFAG